VERILVSVDGSDASERVLDWLGGSQARAHIYLIKVVHLPRQAVETRTLSAAQIQLLAEARAYLERLGRRLAPARVELVVRAGDPGPVIASVAATLGVDLVAMVGHGRADAPSVAQFVTAHAPVPTLVFGPLATAMRQHRSA